MFKRLVIHLLLSHLLVLSTALASDKICSPESFIKSIVPNVSESTTPTWQKFATEADAYYARITELMDEDHTLLNLPHRSNEETLRLEKVTSDLASARNDLLTFNQKNHAYLDFTRAPDQSYSSIESIDQAAEKLREERRGIVNDIELHIQLKAHLRADESLAAGQELKSLQKKLRDLDGKLKPLEEKIATQFRKSPPELRMKQITGKENIPGETPKNIETADPFIYHLSDGRVKLLGSGWVDREYASMDHLMRNIGEKITTTDLRYPDGEVIENKVYGMGGPVWDKSIVEAANGEEVLYASALSPKKYRIGGLPTDPAYTTTATENWTRRIYSFEKKIEIVHPLTGEKKIWKDTAEFLHANPNLNYADAKQIHPHVVWIRNRTDLWGNVVPMQEDWHGHSYGVKIRLGDDWKPLRDKDGHAYMEFDYVTANPDGTLGDTHPYSQKLVNPHHAEGPMTKLMQTEYQSVDPASGVTETKSYPITVRSFNQKLKLIEGPQTAPQLLKMSDLPALDTLPPATRDAFLKRWGKPGVSPEQLQFKITSVAAGDYPTKDYGELVGLRSVAPGESLASQMGELKPVTEVKPNGEVDLAHLGRQQGIVFRQSWGPSRPLFFKYQNTWWAMDHSVDETVVSKYENPRRWPPDQVIDQFHRNVNITPLRPVIMPDGQISFEKILGILPP